MVLTDFISRKGSKTKQLLKGIYKFYKTCRIVTMQWIVEHQKMHWRDVLKPQIKPSKTTTIMTQTILLHIWMYKKWDMGYWNAYGLGHRAGSLVERVGPSTHCPRNLA